jgi:hypothetical protein
MVWSHPWLQESAQGVLSPACKIQDVDRGMPAMDVVCSSCVDQACAGAAPHTCWQAAAFEHSPVTYRAAKHCVLGYSCQDSLLRISH